jgi:hypothetical protein
MQQPGDQQSSKNGNTLKSFLLLIFSVALKMHGLQYKGLSTKGNKILTLKQLTSLDLAYGTGIINED